MWSRQLWLAAVALGCAVAGGSAARAQARFVPVARESLPIVPGLEVVTVRDTVQDACYVVFTFDLRVPSTPSSGAPPLDVAVAERDRRLQELSAEFDRSQYNVAPAVPPPNVLKYEWEAQKAEGDVGRAFMAAEFARLEGALAQLARAPRIAVAGPAPCGPKPAPANTPQK